MSFIFASQPPGVDHDRYAPVDRLPQSLCLPDELGRGRVELVHVLHEGRGPAAGGVPPTHLQNGVCQLDKGLVPAIEAFLETC